MACRRLAVQLTKPGLNQVIVARDLSQCTRTLPAVFHHHALSPPGFHHGVVVDRQHRVSLVPGSSHTSSSTQKLGYSTSHYERWTDLTYEDLVALLDSGDIQLFDVREEREIQETGMIPGAVNIPLGDVKESMKMEDARFTERYKVAKPQIHDTNVVFYGLGPIKSSAALEIAHKFGYKKARHYVGGYDEWMQKGGTGK